MNRFIQVRSAPLLSPSIHIHIQTQIYSSQLRALLRPSGLLLVPQHTSQDLARGTFRDDIDELHSALQPLVAGLFLLDELADLALQGDVGFFEPDFIRLHHKRFWHFAGAVVWYGNHGAVGYCWVVEQAGFEFCWSDLEALLGWELIS